MEFVHKSIKDLFKEKINPAILTKTLRKNNFTKIPLYNTTYNNNRKFSFTNRQKMRHYIKNKDISISSYNSFLNKNDESKKRELLIKKNLSKKKSKISEIKNIKSKINSVNNYDNLLINRSLNLVHPYNKIDLSLKNNSPLYNYTKISFVTKTPKIQNQCSGENEKGKIILVQKNKRFFENSKKKSKNKEEKRTSSTNDIINQQNTFYNNINNEINNKDKNELKINHPYKKKKIMNKQYLNLRLNFLNEPQNIIPTEQYQYISNINNLEIYNILTKSRENSINKNKKYYKINNNKRVGSSSKEKNINNENISEKDIEKSLYNVKNININFNNIKVFNNISKKSSRRENDKKKKIINNNIIKKKIISSIKNEDDEIDSSSIQFNENETITEHRIKVSKTRSTLRIREDRDNSKISNKDLNKKLLNIKSENNLKISIKKKIKIMKIDSCTIEGKSFRQKYNQENFFMKQQFLNQKEQFLIGICNGHGKHGKLISKYIISLLPTLIISTNENDIINAYLETNKYITNENNKIFDCSLSGASCISLIISMDKIISINLGDNKAVLARYENGLYNFINLNREHNPTAPDEKKRILDNNGKIGHLYEKTNSPKKVWLKNSDIPGLPISRSFGDTIAHSVGVISEPEIKTFYFNGNEKFIILSNHSFWEIIDAEKSVEIVKEFYEDNMNAVEALNKLALEILNKCESENKYIEEDITIIIIFFE